MQTELSDFAMKAKTIYFMDLAMINFCADEK